jgi:hypothetical protein
VAPIHKLHILTALHIAFLYISTNDYNTLRIYTAIIKSNIHNHATDAVKEDLLFVETNFHMRAQYVYFTRGHFRTETLP